MRWRVLFFLVILVVLVPSNRAGASKHCYAVEDVQVLDSSRRVVATISKGITFTYRKKRRGYVQFDYYGKKRYASVDGLVTDKRIEDFVQRNPGLFSRRLSAVKGGKVFSTVSTRGRVIQKFGRKEKFDVFGETSRWYKVQVDGRFGYVQKPLFRKYCFIDVTSFYKPSGKTKRQKVVDFAERFIGNPYVWGGTSLTSGCDCSGFVMKVMENFGVTLPRCSYQQAEVGRPVTRDTVRPGDLIFYLRGSRVGHVVMYAGNGRVVEAKGAAYGIVVSEADLDSAYCMRSVLD